MVIIATLIVVLDGVNDFLKAILKLNWYLQEISGHGGIRTLDQLIKSQLLYQLSYMPDRMDWKR